MKNRYIARRRFASIVLGLTVIVALAFSLSVSFTPARASELSREAASSRRPALRGHEASGPVALAHVVEDPGVTSRAPTRERTAAAPALAASLCGEGAPPDYGFTYDLQQPHWTVGWENYASEQAVTEVDTILDRLNADSIAQTMILFLPQDQVGIPVNCAVHFLRYMKLGLTTGEHADNGMVFLIIVGPSAINVHYGVGLGLPALTAPYLTDLNRSGEDAYQSTHSMDQALLTLVRGFDTLARSKYAPVVYLTATPGPISSSSQVPSDPMSILTICGQMCFGLLVILLLLWLASKGIILIPSGGGGFGSSGGDWGGGGGSSMRGGSGSGRSGRGN